MNDYLGELEYLKNLILLTSKKNNWEDSVIAFHNEGIKSIEKELKEGEKDHKLKIDICEYFGLDDLFPYDDNSKIMERLEEIQDHYYDIQFKKSKKEQALEIIKEMLDNDLTEKLNANSRKIFKDIFDNLPKEEYDLLKEVLL